MGALKLWNAAIDQPKEMIKVSPHGIMNICAVRGEKFRNGGVFLLQSKNGSVIVYDVRKRKALFETEVAHTSQAQKCKISMNNCDLMGSCGYDGTLRIWNLQTMQVVSVLEDRQSKKERD